MPRSYVNRARTGTILKRHEGFRLEPYECSEGYPTIGYGRRLDAGFTKEHAEALFAVDLNISMTEVFNIPGVSAIDAPVRKEVLINMHFNLGLDKLLEFKRMWSCIRDQDWNGAAHEMLDSLWSRQVGGRAKELAHMMRTGRVANAEQRKIFYS